MVDDYPMSEPVGSGHGPGAENSSVPAARLEFAATSILAELIPLLSRKNSAVPLSREFAREPLNSLVFFRQIPPESARIG